MPTPLEGLGTSTSGAIIEYISRYISTYACEIIHGGDNPTICPLGFGDLYIERDGKNLKFKFKPSPKLISYIKKENTLAEYNSEELCSLVSVLMSEVFVREQLHNRDK